MPPKNKISNILHMLNKKQESEIHRDIITFEELLSKISQNPTLGIRNIFQLFHDMVHYYVPEGYNKYPDDPESVNYVNYDCTDLFIKDTNTPFFADRLLANKLINVVEAFKKGVLSNKMLVFIGPQGSGKSTFLNNILHKLELYTALPAGIMYDTLWEIDIEKIGNPMLLEFIAKMTSKNYDFNEEIYPDNIPVTAQHFDRYLHIPCPNHDHPIIQIPVDCRREILDKIIDDRETKRLIFYSREYEWIFKKTPCSICSSIYKSLSKKLPFEELLTMIHGKAYEFDRKMGEGISVYNPSDPVDKHYIKNKELQKWIDTLFKSSNVVSYVYSKLAKTNNGIFAIMDAKSNNVDRFKNIHSIISDGTHKVDIFEENIDSLFMALVNPEDMEFIAKEKSFLDRIIKIPIPYIRDYSTEIDIYKGIYTEQIENYFMPRVLEAFAKAIVSSRLNAESEAINNWIKDKNAYHRFIDKDFMLLRMEIFAGNIPAWLTETDIKALNKKTRRELLSEGDNEGFKGFSGRQSLDMINKFIAKYKRANSLITIENIIEFFKDKSYIDKIPDEFMASLMNLYDYHVLQEVKEAMFFYNENQISDNIKDYLFAISNDPDTKVRSPYTNQVLEITEDYLQSVERFIIGTHLDNTIVRRFRDDTLKTLVSKTLQEEKAGIDLTQTDQYKKLFQRFHSNLKKDVLTPFISNINFRRAIKDYNTASFKNYDKRIKNEVMQLIKNLIFKFKYTEYGAKQVAVYVIDKNLADQFTE